MSFQWSLIVLADAEATQSTVTICYSTSLADFLTTYVVPALGIILLVGAFRAGAKSRSADDAAAFFVFLAIPPLVGAFAFLHDLRSMASILESMEGNTLYVGEIAMMVGELSALLLRTVGWTIPAYVVLAWRWYWLRGVRPAHATGVAGPPK